MNPMKTENRTRTRWISVLIILLYLVVSLLRSHHSESSNIMVLLGAEYAYIAESILDGNGYANPFEFPTGPTAWMPPLLVYLNVIVFSLFGISIKAYYFLSAIKFTGFAATFYFLSKAFGKSNLRIHNFFLAAAYLLFLYMGSFQITDLCMEHWLYHLIGALLIYSYISFMREGKKVALLSVLFLLSPLATPSLFIPQAVILFIIFVQYLFKKRIRIISLSPRILFIHFVLFGLLSTLSVSLWTYRNYRVFNELIVSKPNAWFEFYLANIMDARGIIHRSTFENFHPLYNEDISAKMRESGESAFLAPYSELAREYKENKRGEYRKKILFRLSNIFIFQQKEWDKYPAERKHELPESDLELLAEHKMMRYYASDDYYSWQCLSMPDQMVEEKFEALNLLDRESLFEDYLHAREQIKSYSLTEFLRSFFKAGLITLSLIIFLLAYSRRDSVFTGLVSVFYLIYLAPYIMISFVERYQLFIAGIQALILAGALAFIWEKIRVYLPLQIFEKHK